MSKFRLIALLLLSSTTFASSWHLTYYNVKDGYLLIDKDSIVDSTGVAGKKFWTLFTPRIDMGKPGAGYAYRQSLHSINCSQRTAQLIRDIYFDGDQVPHEPNIAEPGMHDIIPDTQDDYLWSFVCKPERQADLATPQKNNIKELLSDQVKATKQNEQLLKSISGQ